MLAVGVVVIAVDQLIKGLVRGSLAPGERTDLALGIDLTRVMNSGIAFGLFSNGGDALVVAFTALALSLILGWFTLDTLRPGLWLGVGLLIGGALGNLTDRVFHVDLDATPRVSSTARSPISSIRPCGRRSTSPTSRSPPACS